MSTMDERETLDQAVSRIAKESLEAELSREAAIRQGIAWAYRDAGKSLSEYQSISALRQRLERKAKEATRG